MDAKSTYVDPADWLTTAAAESAVAFVNRLTHVKGQWARQPFSLRGWQERIIRELFGRLRPDGTRQYRTAFIFLPRKNGKTNLCAAIALHQLLAEPEAGGEIYSAAVDREQASLVFNVAAQMIRNDPELSRVCRITDSHRKIIYEPTGSIYRAIPADAPHAHGYNAQAVIYDELHAAPNADLWNVLRTSQGARRQPLCVAISTAGHDRHSVCWQVYDYACKVRDGIIKDDSFLPVIFEAPADANWQDERTWEACNPALDDFRSRDEMRQLAREAQEIPARQTTFEQLYLNRWTETSARWIAQDVWDQCGEEFNPADLEGLDCYAGLDLAYRDDFAALSLVFRQPDAYYLLPFFWIPAEGRRKLNRPPVDRWITEGHVETTPGPSTDFHVIREKINELGSIFRIVKIAVDPWNARQLASELMEDGFDVENFPQTMKNFTEPTKTFESLIRSQRIRHGGNPVLRWMASNVCITSDSSGNYRPSKDKSSEKIDGIVASLMAIALANAEPERESNDDLPPFFMVQL